MFDETPELHGSSRGIPVSDSIFAEQRLAEIYDPLDPDRSDLDAYLDLVDELGADSVLDIGCGTGTFACLLAETGRDVVGVDPAAASLEVARCKPGADEVRWVHGDATTLPPIQVDLATMTANVAQVFLTDEAWTATLRATRTALRPGGWLVFETRDPRREAWREWTREHTHRRVHTAEAGTIETWLDLIEVALPLVTFRGTYIFESDGTVLTSESTLRFRTPDEIVESLRASALAPREVRDAPDRPGKEFVFIAQRPLGPLGPYV